MPTPIGPETSWLCPSLNPTQSGSPDELISGVAIGTASTTTAVWTSDTDNGGTYSVTGDNAKRQFNTMLGVASTDTVTKVGASMWVKFDSSDIASGTSEFDLFRFDGGDAEFSVTAEMTAGVDIGGGNIIGTRLTLNMLGSCSNFGTFIFCPLKLQQSGTYADWESYWTGWHHIYVELDYANSSTDYSYFATTPYFRLYIDGTYVDNALGPVWGNPNDAGDGGVGGGTSPTVGDSNAGGTGNTNFVWDDLRVFCNTFPTASELTTISSARGVEGGSPPVGLGDEQLWLCPSINDSANDISGNGNNGTLTGGAAIVSDSGSGGTKSFKSFTTSTDRVDIPAGVFTDGNDVSFSAWVKSDLATVGAKDRNIVRTTNNDFVMRARQTIYKGIAGGVEAQDNLGSLNTTEYYHYALNYDNATSTIELFRNGVSVATASSVPALALTGTLDILQNLLAHVDDVRAYNRKLTQAEITHLATSRGIEGSPSGPPSSAFHNPFKSKAFYTLIGQRIR
jgi:hypothetical protein